MEKNLWSLEINSECGCRDDYLLEILNRYLMLMKMAGGGRARASEILDVNQSHGIYEVYQKHISSCMIRYTMFTLLGFTIAH